MKWTLIISTTSLLVMTSLSSFAQNIDSVRYSSDRKPKVEIFGLNLNAASVKHKNLSNSNQNPYQNRQHGSQNNTSIQSMGGVATGGGNFCENRFFEVSNDIKNWIMNDGPYTGNIKLPAGVTVAKHNSEILQWIAASQVICVMRTEKEPYPVKIDGVPKACAWVTNQKNAVIACDYFAVMGDKSHAPMTDDDFYATVYHEYASLAGIEPPDGSKSSYVVSNQISAYLENTVVRRLALKKLHSSAVSPTILPTYFNSLHCNLSTGTGPSYKVNKFTILMPPDYGGVDIPALIKMDADYEIIFMGSYSGKPHLQNTNDKALFTFSFDGYLKSYEAIRRADGKVELFWSDNVETENYVCEGPLAPVR